MGSVYQIVSVEDDSGIFNLIEATLRPLPVKLHHVCNGHEALPLISQLKPDIVVLDIALPDIRGWDLLSQIEALEGDQPDIVILSALVESGRPHYPGNLKSDQVFSKPFMPAAFRHHVSELLGLS